MRKTCQACLRHDEYPISHHPVFSNTVSNFNDEISIDFVWGFPEGADHKYKGIMMIEEEISKNAVLYPILRKGAERSDNEAGLTSEALVNLKELNSTK